MHVVSDVRHALRGARVTARLSWPGGGHAWRWSGDVAADACERVGTVSFVVPEVTGPLALDLDLVCGDVAVSNRYEGVIAG